MKDTILLTGIQIRESHSIYIYLMIHKIVTLGQPLDDNFVNH